MAIKQLDYNKGEELNIRSYPRLQSAEILEKINETIERTDMLIVKCGKSFWDVTKAPEIFEQADEFNPESLTGIEKKEMQKSNAPAPAYEDNYTLEDDPMNLLFHRTEEEPEYVRKTYYLTPTQVEWLRLLCFHRHEEVSEMVRQIFDCALPILSEAYGDLGAQAANNVSQNPPKTKKRKRRS